MTRRRLVVPAVMVWMVACGDAEPSMPEPRWEQQGIQYFASAEDGTVCAEVLTRMVAHRTAFATELGVEWEDAPLRYFKYRGYVDLDEHSRCGPATSGCLAEPPSEVEAADAAQWHELAHVWAEGLFHHDRGALAEGFATATTCSPKTENPHYDPARAPYGVLRGENGEFDSGAMGVFVTELLREGSAERLGELQDRFLAGDKTPAALEAGVRALYGQGVAEVWARAADRFRPQCFPVGRCAAASPLRAGNNVIESRCDGLQEYRLDRSLGAVVGLTVGGESRLRLFSCEITPNRYSARETSLGSSNHDDEATEFIVESPSIPHLVTVAKDPRALVAANVHFRTLPGALMETCPSDEVAAVAWSPGLLLEQRVPGREGRWWTRLDYGAASRASFWWDVENGYPADALAGIRAWLCPRCGADPATECTAVAEEGATTLEASVGTYVLVESDGIPPAAVALQIAHGTREAPWWVNGGPGYDPWLPD